MDPEAGPGLVSDSAAGQGQATTAVKLVAFEEGLPVIVVAFNIGDYSGILGSLVSDFRTHLSWQRLEKPDLHGCFDNVAYRYGCLMGGG